MKRKGARSIKDIPADVLQQLNSGQIETANLVEWLALNPKILLENLLKQNNRTEYLKPTLANIDRLNKKTVNTINEAIGTQLFELATENNDSEFLAIISNHSADTIRCWATYTIGRNKNLSLDETLRQIQPFSADKHFGVREISWLAVRPKIAQNLRRSIEILSNWTTNVDENIRRFATESTRPRGVWCEHIDELKQNPELALTILEPLKNDSAKYVQNSVGNWLNDASKSKPNFVNAICEKWTKESNTKATAYIIKKALRTIEKK